MAARPSLRPFPPQAMSVVIITILNDGTIISIAYDFVFASKSPEKWNMKALTLVSSVIGLTAMLSSLLLLHQCLCSNQSESSLEMVGVAGLEYGEIQVTTPFRFPVPASWSPAERA
jgi:H+-transporting ATPase